MNLAKQIEGAIIAGSEDFFDRPSDRENLRVTVRVAQDFYNFLVERGENPSASEVTYAMETIWSGMDWFFPLAHACTAINTPRATWDFDARRNWDFPSLRQEFLRRFENLANGAETGAPAKLAELLALTHLQLVFLAQHFPSTLFKEIHEAVDRRKM
jgi:hypothetical protein